MWSFTLTIEARAGYLSSDLEVQQQQIFLKMALEHIYYK